MNDLSDIDPQQIRKLALQGATDRDLCEFFGWSEAELYERFDSLLVQARAARRISLRKRQTAVAIEGSAGMLSFLGKHELGQTEKDAPADDAWPLPQLDYKMG